GASDNRRRHKYSVKLESGLQSANGPKSRIARRNVAVCWEKLIVILRTRWRIQVSTVKKVGLEILGTLQHIVGARSVVVGVDEVVVSPRSRLPGSHTNGCGRCGIYAVAAAVGEVDGIACRVICHCSGALKPIVQIVDVQ